MAAAVMERSAMEILVERARSGDRDALFDFSNVEAAMVLDKTEGAVKSLQHRALASLQKQMSS